MEILIITLKDNPLVIDINAQAIPVPGSNIVDVLAELVNISPAEVPHAYLMAVGYDPSGMVVDMTAVGPFRLAPGGKRPLRLMLTPCAGEIALVRLFPMPVDPNQQQF